MIERHFKTRAGAVENLRTDPKRIGRCHGRTQIYVRAKGPQGFDVFDIAELTRESLLTWLRSRGEMNQWAENVLCVLLDYPALVPGRLSDVFLKGE